MSYSSISLGGMNAAMNQLDRSAWRIARQANPSPPDVANPATPPAAAHLAAGANASLEADVVGQLQAKNALLVSLRVFRTGDEMLGALIDTKA